MQGNQLAIRDRHVLGRWAALGLTWLTLLAAIGHVYYWYWPRSRSAQPHSTSEVAGLVLGETGPEIRVWVPYPHQNLGALERHLGGLDTVGVAIEDLLGTTPVKLPSFGPFRLPPAREMALATDRDGESLVAVARVYPVAAWLFRAAGWLASNPWMAGGESTLGGRRVRVAWQGDLWMATTEKLDWTATSAQIEAGPSLALVRLQSPVGPVPSGLFRIVATQRRLLLSSTLQEMPVSSPNVDEWQAQGVALAWIHLARMTEARDVQALIALSGFDTAGGRFPPLMMVQTAGAESKRLPGEGILEAIGVQVHSRSMGAWELRAYEEEPFGLGQDLVAGLEALSEDVRSEENVTVGFVDLDEARRALSEVAQALQQVPVIGENEARRWLALARLLEGLPGESVVSIWMAEPDRLEVEIRPQSVD